ncbi:MAG: hypothetical protein IT158_22695 [Bryobacterales bacterium]|nr:hypothetical protein [Bryobacterales bacterium]
MLRSHCILWLAAALAAGRAGAQSAHVHFPEPLAAWAREIERVSGGAVRAARIYTDPLRNELRLPADAPAPELIAHYLRDDSFRAQFAAAHALTVNHNGPRGKTHLILLNMARADEWTGEEEGLLAHELGHAWLDARGFAAPVYVPGPRSCVGVLAGDIVQHVLIREETERRGVSQKGYWMRQLRSSGTQPAPEPCQRLIQLAHLVDARLGLTGRDREVLARFESGYRASAPRLPEYARAIEAVLAGDPGGREGFATTVRRVREILESVYDGAPFQATENKEENR